MSKKNKKKSSYGFCSHHRKGHEDYYAHTIRLKVGSHETRLCARCTGIYLGFILTTIFFIIFGFSILPLPGLRQTLPIGAINTVILMIIFSLPMIIDWGVQKLTWYARESTNTRRVITGFCLGIGLSLFQFTWDVYLFSIMFMGLYTVMMLIITKLGHVKRDKKEKENLSSSEEIKE
ncbi:MAG: DUF2085 domain-containing protein [Candidatus Helarchaeota archaeon]